MSLTEDLLPLNATCARIRRLLESRELWDRDGAVSLPRVVRSPDGDEFTTSFVAEQIGAEHLGGGRYRLP